MSYDLSSKCRTCLSESNAYHHLYDYVEENYKILEMLDSIVPQIDIKTSSQFSTLVCEVCADKLLTSYKFQQLCIDTNNRLHDLTGIAAFETEPKLEKISDPLTGDSNFKLKLEVEEDAIFAANNCVPDGDSDTDSSNEKLSVLKERSSKKITIQIKNFEKPNEQNSCDGFFPCTECGKSCSSINRLKQHRATHDKKKRAYSCQICNTSIKSEKTFNVHMSKHRSTEDGFENITQKKYNFKGIYEAEEFLVGNERKDNDGEVDCKDLKELLSFECPDCPKCFEKKASLSAHYKVHQKRELLKNKSKHLGQGFQEEHELLDNGEDVECEVSGELDNFQCPECHKSFEKKASLSAHYKVHKKKELLKKSNFQSISQEDTEYDSPNKFCEQANEELEYISKVIVKEEMEIAPQMLDGNEDWFNNEFEESDDNSEYELFTKSGVKDNKNIDFVDTGIGEVEKPNSSNKRNGNFPCEVCGKIFDRPYRLKRHSSVHSLVRPHECEICKYRFATANILKAHLFQHKNETGGTFHSQSRPEGFKCPDCPRRFEKQASLSAHRQSHTRNTSEANYPCIVCQRNFMSIRSLTEHITNKHPEVEKHKCNQCEKTFILHAHLVEHLNRHKGNRNLVCLICEKEFGYNNTLKEHMRTHSGESPYLCPQCGKTFRSASNLRQHMERHTGLKKYQCPECPSRFNCRSDLIKHASTHSNAKPHVCDICGSRFTRAYSLQKHKLLHSGERPFKCDQCSMTFAIIYHLRRHMRTHTGEKPYKCKYCERAYAESGDLTKHLRTHVGENTYMCDKCPMAFKYQAELRKHQSQHYIMEQKLLQKTEKFSEGAQQNNIEQIQQDQQSMQQQQQNQIQDQSNGQTLLKSEQMQHLPVGIPSYQQTPLIDQRQQLITIEEQTPNQTKNENGVGRQEDLDIKNFSN